MFHGLLLVAVLAIVVPAVSVPAQLASGSLATGDSEREILRIERFEPDQIEVEAGNDAVLLLRGSSLNELTEARVISGGADAAGVVGALAAAESASVTSRTLRITTTVETPPGHYRVQLRAGRGVVATFARFDLTITEPDLSPKIIDAIFDQAVVENTPLRIRVRTDCVGGLAKVRASVGDQRIEATPLARDPRMAEFEIIARGVGRQPVELVAVDVADRTSDPMIRTIEIVAAIADLSITDMTFNPEVAHVGESIGAFVTIANTGAIDASLEPGSILLRWRVDDKSERDFAVGNPTVITAGHEHVYGPLIFEVDHAGDHAIAVILDPVDIVAESNEANNDWARPVSVGPRRYADLVIAAVMFDPPDPSAAAPFRATVRIMNQGNATATIFPPDLIVRAEGFNELRAGPQALTLRPSQLADLDMEPLTETIVSRRKQWLFSLDPDNRVAESVEDNNSYTASMGVGKTGDSLPDLVIDTATVRPSEPAAGESMFIVLGIKNVGDAEAILPAGHTFYQIDGPMGRIIPIETQMAERIAPGKTRGMRTEDFSIEEAGTYELSIQLDPNGATGESRKDNNFTAMTVLVK